MDFSNKKYSKIKKKLMDLNFVTLNFVMTRITPVLPYDESCSN